MQTDAAMVAAGGAMFNVRCNHCHGPNAIPGGTAPDLRASVIPTDAEAFRQVVREGALEPNGMPRFYELTAKELEQLRQFIRAQAQRKR